jgi:hypothetical protein
VTKLEGEPRKRFFAALDDYATVCQDAASILWAGKNVDNPREYCLALALETLEYGETDGVGPFESVRSVLLIIYKKTAEVLLPRLRKMAKAHSHLAPTVEEVAAFMDAAHQGTGALPTQAIGTLEKASHARPESEWTLGPVRPELAIVSKELWAAVQARNVQRAARVGLPKVKRGTKPSPLATLVRRGTCGGPMSLAGRRNGASLGVFDDEVIPAAQSHEAIAGEKHLKAVGFLQRRCLLLKPDDVVAAVPAFDHRCRTLPSEQPRCSALTMIPARTQWPFPLHKRQSPTA